MKNIILMAESVETITRLPDEAAGALVKALARVLNGEERGPLPFEADLVFPLIAGQVVRMDDLHEKRAAAGRAGGSKPKAKGKQNEANEKQTASPNQNQYQNQNHISRNARVQKAYGFSLERKGGDYNEIARRLREEQEAAE